MDIMEDAPFRYDTVEVENSLYSVVNVVEIEKESISTTVTTLLRHVYDHMETTLKKKKIAPKF